MQAEAGSDVRTRFLIELDALTEQIWQDLGGQVPSTRVRQVVLDVASQFHNATVTTYLPIFVRRLARERLEEQRATVKYIVGAADLIDLKQAVTDAGNGLLEAAQENATQVAQETDQEESILATARIRVRLAQWVTR